MIGELSTNAQRSPTLGGVDRGGAMAVMASRRARARCAAIALALVAIAVPELARAQEESDETTETEEAAETATEDGDYEPDQRGEHDEEEATGGEGYEPDQRGEHDEPQEELDAAVGVATAAYERGEALDRGLGFDVQLWLGAGFLGIDAAGGDNLVRATQRSSISAALGLAAGLRLGPVIVGPRVGLSIDPTMLLANVALGADVLLLDGDIAPYVRASLGLTLAAPLGDQLPAQSEASILGVGLEVGVGARWRFYRGLYLGLELAGGWHHLWREALPSCTGECADADLDLRMPGESDALTLRLSLSVGWAF